MKLTLLLIIPLILFSSCTIDWNDEKDKKIAGLEKQVTVLKEQNDDESFKKKQECSNLAEEMLKFAKNYNNNIYGLWEIFYSSTKNSCFFTAKAGDPFGLVLLFDFFSKTYVKSNEIWICEKTRTETCYKMEQDLWVKYEQTIKELKWE